MFVKADSLQSYKHMLYTKLVLSLIDFSLSLICFSLKPPKPILNKPVSRSFLCYELASGIVSNNEKINCK